MQTAGAWPFVPFSRSEQNHLVRPSEKGKATTQTNEEVNRQHQGIDRCGVKQSRADIEEQVKLEGTGCKVICGATYKLGLKGSMIIAFFVDFPFKYLRS